MIYLFSLLLNKGGTHCRHSDSIALLIQSRSAERRACKILLLTSTCTVPAKSRIIHGPRSCDRPRMGIGVLLLQPRWFINSAAAHINLIIKTVEYLRTGLRFVLSNVQNSARLNAVPVSFSEPESSRQMCSVYYCCRWDVQKQIFNESRL